MTVGHTRLLTTLNIGQYGVHVRAFRAFESGCMANTGAAGGRGCCSPPIFIYLYINSGRWYLSHVPSTFETVNTHANVFFVFLPGGISKECRHIVSANCDFEAETGPTVPMFTGLSGNTWETAKIAHGSHNDVRHLCWRHLRSDGRTWAAKGPVIFTGCS